MLFMSDEVLKGDKRVEFLESQMIRKEFLEYTDVDMRYIFSRRVNKPKTPRVRLVNLLEFFNDMILRYFLLRNTNYPIRFNSDFYYVKTSVIQRMVTRFPQRGTPASYDINKFMKDNTVRYFNKYYKHVNDYYEEKPILELNREMSDDLNIAIKIMCGLYSEKSNDPQDIIDNTYKFKRDHVFKRDILEYILDTKCKYNNDTLEYEYYYISIMMTIIKKKLFFYELDSKKHKNHLIFLLNCYRRALEITSHHENKFFRADRDLFFQGE